MSAKCRCTIWIGAIRESRRSCSCMAARLTAHTWDLCCLALRDEFHCIALDQRGHGDTDWAPDADYSIAAQRERRQRLCRHARPRPVRPGRHVDGRDQRAGLRGPLPASGSRHLVHDRRRPGGAGARDRAASAISSMAAPMPESLDAIIERALAFNPRRDPEDPAPQPDAQSAAADRRHRSLEIRPQPLPRAAPGGASGRAGEPSPTGLAQAIACPTLVVRGGESDVFHDEDAERLAARLPNGRWVKIPGAGHTVQGDNPKGLVAELRGFLARDAEPSDVDPDPSGDPDARIRRRVRRGDRLRPRAGRSTTRLSPRSSGISTTTSSCSSAGSS